MTQDEIMEMAKQVGVEATGNEYWPFFIEELMDFAKLVAERAIKEALAQPEQEPVAWMDADGNVSDNNDHKCFPIPLYTISPQRTWVGAGDLEDSNSYLDTPPQPEQEPVAIKRMKEWIEYLKYLKRTSDQYMKIPSEMSAGTCWELAIELEQFINTTPPQRKPLSAEQVSEICAEWTDENGNTGSFGRRQIARAIEAAHNIKEKT